MLIVKSNGGMASTAAAAAQPVLPCSRDRPRQLWAIAVAQQAGYPLHLD